MAQLCTLGKVWVQKMHKILQNQGDFAHTWTSSSSRFKGGGGWQILNLSRFFAKLSTFRIRNTGSTDIKFHANEGRAGPDES